MLQRRNLCRCDIRLMLIVCAFFYSFLCIAMLIYYLRSYSIRCALFAVLYFSFSSAYTYLMAVAQSQNPNGFSHTNTSHMRSLSVFSSRRLHFFMNYFQVFLLFVGLCRCCSLSHFFHCTRAFSLHFGVQETAAN